MVLSGIGPGIAPDVPCGDGDGLGFSSPAVAFAHSSMVGIAGACRGGGG